MSKEQLIQRGRITEDFVTKAICDVGKQILTGDNDSSCDLTFICSNGKIRAHQIIVGYHSQFLRNLFLRRHLIEFDIVDWHRSLAHLFGRRLPEEEVVVVLKDFDCVTVKRMLSLFYTGRVPFSSPDDGIKLKDLWNILQIESFQLSELKKSTDQQGTCDELGFGVKSKEKESHVPRRRIKRTRRSERDTSSDDSSDSDNSENKIRKISVSRTQKCSASTSAGIASAQSSSKLKRNVLSSEKPKSDIHSDVPKSTSRSCPICKSLLNLKSSKQLGSVNRDPYVKHIISHVKDELFEEIPKLDYYYCPYNGCLAPKFFRPFNFMRHLATVHGEFLPRIERRLQELERNKLPEIDEKVQQLTEIRDFTLHNCFFEIDPDDIPVTLCNESEVFKEYERRLDVVSGGGRKQLRCTNCENSFWSSSAAVVHLFADHGQPFVTQDGNVLHDVGLTKIQRSSFAKDVRSTFECPYCSFSTFRKSSIISHLGFSHNLFKHTDIVSLIDGISLGKLFLEERVKKDEHDEEHVDVVKNKKDEANVQTNGTSTTTMTFDDFSSESSDDNNWSDESAEKVANSNPSRTTRLQKSPPNDVEGSSRMLNAAEPKRIKILGSATIPRFPEDETDLQVINIDSE